MEVTIAIATYGDEKWIDLAQNRAIPSAEEQRVPVLHRHGETLAGARNELLEACSSPWVIFLDADDELDRKYVKYMSTGTADVRAPSVRRFANGRARRGTYMPKVYRHRHNCVGDCLPEGNWITVGACARVDLLKEVGGWGDEPVYEDWALWLRCWKAGATFEAIPRAVYGYHWMPDSRNHALPNRDEWHHKIHESIMEAA